MWWLSPCCSNIAPLRSDLIRPDRGCQPLGAAGSCFRNANSSNTRCDAWNMKTEARRGLLWAPGTCQHGHAPGTSDSANQRPEIGALWPLRCVISRNAKWYFPHRANYQVSIVENYRCIDPWQWRAINTGWAGGGTLISVILFAGGENWFRSRPCDQWPGSVVGAGPGYGLEADGRGRGWKMPTGVIRTCKCASL